MRSDGLGIGKNSMRVVLDTNVLVSALLFGGRLQYIVELLVQGDIRPCFSFSTWRELDRVFHYPHLQSALRRRDVSPQELLSRDIHLLDLAKKVVFRL